MGDVVSLSEHKPHLAGEARCMACQHEFVAVAPVGTTFLKCPNCHCDRALLRFPCVREDEDRWTCLCGNNLFHIVAAGTYCPNCGTWQAGF